MLGYDLFLSLQGEHVTMASDGHRTEALGGSLGPVAPLAIFTPFGVED